MDLIDGAVQYEEGGRIRHRRQVGGGGVEVKFTRGGDRSLLMAPEGRGGKARLLSPARAYEGRSRP